MFVIHKLYFVLYFFKFFSVSFSVSYCMPSSLLHHFVVRWPLVRLPLLLSYLLVHFLSLSFATCPLLSVAHIMHAFPFLLQNFLDFCPVVPSCVGFVSHVWGV